MVTTLTDSMFIVRSALSRVRAALAPQPAMAVAPVFASWVSATAVPVSNPNNPTTAMSMGWLGAAGFVCGGHEGTYTTKRIHPGRLGGST